MKYILILIIIIYFVGPRFFGGLRIDDILLLSISFYLLIFSILKNNKWPRSANAMLFFLITSIIFSLYGMINLDLNSTEIIVPLLKYVLCFSAYISFYLVFRDYDFSFDLLNRVVLFCILINTVWLAVQLAFGSYFPLFVSEGVSTYGIVLIGEQAVFQVGMMISISVFFVFHNFITAKTIILKWFFCIWFVFLLYALFLTQSRISLFVTVLAIIFLYSSLSTSLITKFLIFSVVIFLSVIGFLLDVEINNLFGGYQRFSGKGLDSSLNVRYDEIWTPLILSFSENPIFGSGIGVVPSLTNTSEAHNYYLRILAEGGVAYFLVFLYLILQFSITALFLIKNKYNFLLGIYCLSAIFILCVTGIVQESFLSNKVAVPFFALFGIAFAELHKWKLKNV